MTFNQDKTNRKFRFREFRVYNDARNFAQEIKKISNKKFPSQERFSLLTQLWRAADSVILNIAEGSDRGTDKDFAHFLNSAHTSLNEVVACFDVALDNNYLTTQEHSKFLQEAAQLANQITAFRKKLLSEPTK